MFTVVVGGPCWFCIADGTLAEMVQTVFPPARVGSEAWDLMECYTREINRWSQCDGQQPPLHHNPANESTEEDADSSAPLSGCKRVRREPPTTIDHPSPTKATESGDDDVAIGDLTNHQRSIQFERSHWPEHGITPKTILHQYCAQHAQSGLPQYQTVRRLLCVCPLVFLLDMVLHHHHHHYQQSTSNCSTIHGVDHLSDCFLASE